MELLNNFISIVTIGNFNPAILTPSFLIRYCDFSKELELKKGQTTPVVSKLDYENILFNMDLGRFQVLEKGIQDTKNVKILKYLLKYFEILKYTPIYIMGINFNSTILNIDTNVLFVLDDGEKLKEFFNVENIIYTNTVKIGKSSIARISWELTFMSVDGYKEHISIKYEGNDLLINQNFEIGDINTESVKVNRIINEYLELEKLHVSLLEYLIMDD